MNSQYSTAYKSVPYEIVFGQPPRLDTNLANLFENNHFYPPTEESSLLSDSQTLVSETDSQELNNDVESSEIGSIYFEEIRQDNSDVNNNTDEEINKMYSNMDEDEAQEMNTQNNFLQDYSEARITSNEIIIIDDSDSDSNEDRRYTVQEKAKWMAYSGNDTVKNRPDYKQRVL
ncbi:16685_t:CDS:2 [Racocetra fulgida]|uniref:16685_t:CDS:1 n=1 Tax=Racocetra fulgida TaxID=60492 RepID=A0A9N9C941_9GLOM|nr:16685_t:CDS:2 [Racocetra fulgida]